LCVKYYPNWKGKGMWLLWGKASELQYLLTFLAVLKFTLQVTLGFTWIVERSVKARLHYLLRTINSEESLKVNGENSPFIKSNHSRWGMKEAGHGQFVFALDESPKLNNVNKSVTVWSTSVYCGCFFCLPSGWFEMEGQPHTIGPSFLKQFLYIHW
jgi:hypothetical protein